MPPVHCSTSSLRTKTGANRLASDTTTGNNATTTSFTYDAYGARVVRDEGANETVYIGGVYEEDDDATRSYYTFGGSVVAYRLQEGATDERYYLVSDHLGTNSHQIKYSDGTRESQYYLPYGGDRGSTAGTFDTDRGDTGQVSDAAHTGLLFYNARYYDPTLRRFISADTIIPNPGNPQDLNRYTYVRNNPVRYNDPTGHAGNYNLNYDGGGSGSDGNYGHGNRLIAAQWAERQWARDMPTAGAYDHAMYFAPGWDAELGDMGGYGGWFIELLEWTDIGDVAAVSGENLHGEQVGTGEQVAGGIGLAVPFLSGRALRKLSEFFGFGRKLCSFSADTEVVMVDGSTKPISQVAVGDWVLAHDPETGERGPRRVTHVWLHDDVLVDLGIDGDAVTTTEDHPFWNHTDQQWQRADTLDPGDLLLTATGDTIPVDSIDWTTTHQGTAYNLTIADIHTYHVTVGDTSVLVHNVRGCEEAARSIRNRLGGGDIWRVQAPDQRWLAADHRGYLEAIERGDAWNFHEFVVKDGLAYDDWYDGIPLDQYRELFPLWDDLDVFMVAP